MKDDNRTKEHPQSPEENLENTSPPSVWKRVIKSKWFFPAVYLAAAALILAFITWYQTGTDFAVDPEDSRYDMQEQEGLGQGQEPFDVDADEESLPVAAGAEEMRWPVADENSVQVVVGYFDDASTPEEQEAAMIRYDQSFHPSQGYDLAREDGEIFDIVSVLSGTVIAVDRDALVGHYVESEHADGLVTVYQSLDNIQVEVGDEVIKGEFIAQSGRSVFRQDLGVHVHFEVHENNEIVNPGDFLSQ